MKAIHFKTLRCAIIGWTLTTAIILILAAIFCKQVASEFTESYHSYHKNLTWIKPKMKMVNNSFSNSSFYEYDSNSQGIHKELLDTAHKRATIIVVLLTTITGAFFHLMGFIGSVKCIHCLVLTFAIYMTFSSVMLFINSFTNYWQFIPFLFCSMITVLSFCLSIGIREERFRVVGVGVIEPSNMSRASIDTIGYNRPETVYKLYPDLSQQIFYLDSPSIKADCTHHGNVSPSAPPLPSDPQHLDFSNF